MRNRGTVDVLQYPSDVSFMIAQAFLSPSCLRTIVLPSMLWYCLRKSRMNINCRLPSLFLSTIVRHRNPLKLRFRNDHRSDSVCPVFSLSDIAIDFGRDLSRHRTNLVFRIKNLSGNAEDKLTRRFAPFG
ncbi:hypothetical protein Hypma_010555 [Hypsizygus marmoreus]|uniref:Uncharacterized protein n=1 Tax=Hypsizygus marmoreus TaxID=39966 RepID=A0A369JJI1_HYPMA|nr:hypothetical protein Hypma_010555 [Hypsizygus marmoreus]